MNTADKHYGFNELSWIYLRGQSLRRNQCVLHKGGQPVAGRLRRHSLAGQTGLKAV